MLSRAFWITAAGRGELRPEELEPARDGEVLVRTLATGISRGTEALVFRGGVPASQHAAMRAPMMGGAFPFPVKYGYSAVGLTPDGRRVFVLHPHQDRFVVPLAACVPIPDDVPSLRATLAANAETALNIVWDARPVVGGRMMVIGAGVVGLLVASLLARVPLASVTVLDIDPGRAALVERLGCRFMLSGQADADQDMPGQELPGREMPHREMPHREMPHRERPGQELIVHASGTQAGLRTALAHAATEGTIVEASWFGSDAPSLPLGEAFHARRLRLVSSQVGAVAPAMRGRRSHAERLALALELLRADVYDLLLEPPTPFELLPAAMPGLLAGGLCHPITYGTTACTV